MKSMKYRVYNIKCMKWRVYNMKNIKYNMKCIKWRVYNMKNIKYNMKCIRRRVFNMKSIWRLISNVCSSPLSCSILPFLPPAAHHQTNNPSNLISSFSCSDFSCSCSHCFPILPQIISASQPYHVSLLEQLSSSCSSWYSFLLLIFSICLYEFRVFKSISGFQYL